MTARQKTPSAWTSPADLRQQIQRLWDRGELLRTLLTASFSTPNVPSGLVETEPLLAGQSQPPESSITGCPVLDPLDADRRLVTQPGGGAVDAAAIAANAGSVEFPRKLTLKKPGSKQLSDQFAQVRTWIQSLAECRYIRIEYRETRHLVLGRNSLPNSAWVDTLNDALLLINRSTDARRFESVSSAIVAHDARLLAWLHKRPLKALELMPVCEKLIRVHGKMQATPAPGIYLRQLGVAGVDTKFIEQHRDTLAEWLDLTQSEHAINGNYQGIKGFANRYGYRDKPLRLRLRSLDASCPFPGFLQSPSQTSVQTTTEQQTSESVLTDTLLQADVTLDISVIRQLRPTHRCVLITENEINYLALPDISGTLALFGAGYGWQSLQNIVWLQTLPIIYWGDIDTHGFAILDDLRACLPHVQSLLMDRDTLLAHESHWGQEPTPTDRQLDRLTEAEGSLYLDLVANRYGDNIRLEQEQLDFNLIAQVLTNLEAFAN